MSNRRRKLNGMILTGSALAGLASTTANTANASFGKLFNGLKDSAASGLGVVKNSAKNLGSKLKEKSETLILFIKSLPAAVGNRIAQYVKSVMGKETLEDIKKEMLSLCTDEHYTGCYIRNVGLLFKLSELSERNFKILYSKIKERNALTNFVKILQQIEEERGLCVEELIRAIIGNENFDESVADRLSVIIKNEDKCDPLLAQLFKAIIYRFESNYDSKYRHADFNNDSRNGLISLIKNFDLNSLKFIVKHYSNGYDYKVTFPGLLKHKMFGEVIEKFKLLISSNRPDGSDRLLSVISSGQLKLDSFFLLLQEEEFNSWAANGLLSVIENEKNSSYIADLLNSVFGEGKGKFAKLLAKISKRCTESNDDTLLFNFLKIIDKLGTDKNLYQFGVSFQMLNENAVDNFAIILEKELNDTQLDNFIQLFFLEEKNQDFLNFVGKERFNKNAVKKFASWLKVAGKEELKNFLCFITCASSDTMSLF